jgi:hypothetical protein
MGPHHAALHIIQADISKGCQRGQRDKALQSDNNLLLLRYLVEHGPVPSRKAWAEEALDSDEGRQVVDQRMSVWICGGGWFSGFGLDLQVLTVKNGYEDGVRWMSQMPLQLFCTDEG